MVFTSLVFIALHLPYTHALLQTLLLQGSEVILPLITARAGGKYLRMHNCWTTEIVNYLFFFSTANIYELREVAQFNIFPIELP